MVKAYIAAREQAEAAIARRNQPEPEPQPAPEPKTRPLPGLEATGDEEDRPSVFDTGPDFTAEAVRACIDEIKQAAQEIGSGQSDPIDLHEISSRVQTLLGKQPLGWNSNVLTSSEAAERLIPGSWRLQIGGGYRDKGRRLWEAKAHNRDGRRFVLADGPSLPCCLAEIALVAAMSDAGLS